MTAAAAWNLMDAYGRGLREQVIDLAHDSDIPLELLFEEADRRLPDDEDT